MTKPELEIRIAHQEGAAVLRPRGTLEVVTAPLLRDVLLKSIADQPSAVIAVLDDLELPRVAMLSVFTAVARRTAEWSGVPLMLVSGHAVGTPLEQPVRAIARFLPVYDDIDAAVGAIRLPPPRRVTRLRLPPLPHSASTARRLAVATCEFWDCADLAEDTAAVASELVANAVIHAGTDTELRLELRRGLLTVAITDGSPRRPMPIRRSGTGMPTGGFGLTIVESLAKTWGFVPTSSGGKVVWAVLQQRTRRPVRP
jgi:anti-sigma regulatory factor (Ser/Thr protein kinase)